MNNDNIGKNITKLRKEKNISQSELAKKLNISRQAVSKWEKGKSQPDIQYIKSMSKIFEVDIGVFINEENIAKETINKKSKMNIKNILLTTFISAFIIMLILYFILFINYPKIYTITGEDKNIQINDGLFVVTSKKIFFHLGYLNSTQKVKNIKLYYHNSKNEEVISYGCENCDDLNINIYDYVGYNAHFNIKDLNSILSSTKLEITYEDEVSTIDLNFSKENKKEENKDSTKELSKNDNDELKDLIIETFTQNDDGYIKEFKNGDENITAILIDSNLIFELTTKAERECFTYNFESYNLTYEEYKNEKLISEILLDYKNRKCLEEDCSEENQIFEKFDSLINALK